MRSIKGIVSFLFTAIILLLVLFMIFGSIILFMEFGATKESLIFLLCATIISIPGLIYLGKQLKKLVGI